MSMPITIRLGEGAAKELCKIAERENRSVNEVGAQFIEECIREEQFSLIEYRRFVTGREPCVSGGPQVWQVVMVARDYNFDVEKTANHLVLRPDQIASALSYYAAFPDEIDGALKENNMTFEQLKAVLPNIERVSFELPATIES